MKDLEYLNLNEEFKIYKKVGSKKGEIKNYTSWRERIEEKLNENHFNDNTILNFKRYLIKRRRRCQIDSSFNISVFIPIFVLMITCLITFEGIFMSGMQSNDTMLAEIGNITSQTPQKKIDNIVSQSDILYRIINNIFFAFIIVVIIVFLAAVIITIIHSAQAEKICFYDDLIEILEQKNERK